MLTFVTYCSTCRDHLREQHPNLLQEYEYICEHYIRYDKYAEFIDTFTEDAAVPVLEDLGFIISTEIDERRIYLIPKGLNYLMNKPYKKHIHICLSNHL